MCPCWNTALKAFVAKISPLLFFQIIGASCVGFFLLPSQNLSKKDSNHHHKPRCYFFFKTLILTRSASFTEQLSYAEAITSTPFVKLLLRKNGDAHTRARVNAYCIHKHKHACSYAQTHSQQASLGVRLPHPFRRL